MLLSRLFQRRAHDAGRRERARGVSPSVFRYHAHRNTADGQPNRPRAERKRPLPSFLAWQQLPGTLSLLVIVVAVVYASTLSAEPRVSVVGNDTTLLRSTGEYEQAAADILSERAWSTSKLTIDTVAMSQRLLETFPELSSAEVIVPLLGRHPSLQLVSDQPVLVVKVNDGHDYYVNHAGKVIMRAEDAVERPDVMRLVDQVGLDTSVGGHLLPKATVDFVVELQRQFAARNVDIEAIVLPAAPNEVYVRIEGVDYYIKFLVIHDARLQAGTYFALARELQSRGITPAEYVDVRVEERAYYK